MKICQLSLLLLLLKLMVFHRNLNDSKSPRVYRNLLSIKADCNSADGLDSSSDHEFPHTP